MKTPEEIKNFETKKELAYVAFGKVSYEGCHKIAAKALAYIQRLERDRNWLSENYDLIREENKRLEAQNAELVRKTDKLQSSMGQVEKALQDNGFQTLEELLQAFSQKEA